jgi:hypothetical protein
MWGGGKANEHLVLDRCDGTFGAPINRVGRADFRQDNYVALALRLHRHRHRAERVFGPLGVGHGGELVDAHAKGVEPSCGLLVVLANGGDGGGVDRFTGAGLFGGEALLVQHGPLVELDDLVREGRGELKDVRTQLNGNRGILGREGHGRGKERGRQNDGHHPFRCVSYAVWLAQRAAVDERCTSE